MGLFSLDELGRLYQAIIDAGHVDDGVWKSALSPLMPRYRTTLPGGLNAPGVFQNLQVLARAGRLIDGSIPIEVVLSSLRVLSADGAVNELATRYLARLGAELGPGRGKVRYDAGGKPEAYTGTRDDTVPFDFFERGLLAGRAVMKVQVVRHEGGAPAATSQGPRLYTGTGWLVTRDLVITNVHVVGAREPEEDDPAAGDLGLQMASAELLLDYDREGAGRTARAIAGVAWGVPGGQRDYAILRVTPLAEWPAPLRLQRRISVPPDGYPVNIIQHPAGLAKRVAARSNLLKSADAVELQYFGDTLGGSSGAPLCNDRWEVIGVHYASGPSTGVKVRGREASAYNLGIPIAAILDDLYETNRPIYDEIAPSILA